MTKSFNAANSYPVKSSSRAVKSLGGERIGEYGILWGNEGTKDIVGEYFTKATDELTVIFDAIGKVPIIFHHAVDGKIKSTVIGHIDTMMADDIGLWVEGVVDLAGKYKKAIEALLRKGELYWSSGALPKGRKAAFDGELERWPIIELSLTPTPAEYRMLSRPVSFVKSAYGAAWTDFGDLLRDTGVENTRQEDEPISASAPATKAHQPFSHNSKGEIKMNLQEQFALALSQGEAALEAGDLELGQQKREEAEQLGSAIKTMEGFAALRESMTPIAPDAGLQRPPLPGVGDGVVPAAAKAAEEKETEGNKLFDTIYVAKFGDPDNATKAVYNDLLGVDFKQRIWDQNRAFEKYMRGGESRLSRDETKALDTQIFPSDDILMMLSEGADVATVKATMIEAQGSLGGFAVPPNIQRDIISRLPGLTAVRGGGARIVRLSTGNVYEQPVYSGGDDRYRGALRGAWGSETQTPTEKSATLQMLSISADIYTYKVPFSQSAVEDAVNLVSMITDDISDVMAMDEDETFLIGDGAGKPLGLLPGSANSHSLTEVLSLGSSALTTKGIKALKRGVATQYRKRASWIGNSDTFSDVENLTVSGTGSGFAFPDLSENDKLLKRTVFESEAMPDVGAGAFPLIFGDLAGYFIVERAGLTIKRFQDSGTGINKVEFHVRRRVGGRPVKTWMFAIQKVAAS